MTVEAGPEAYSATSFARSELSMPIAGMHARADALDGSLRMAHHRASSARQAAQIARQGEAWLCSAAHPDASLHWWLGRFSRAPSGHVTCACLGIEEKELLRLASL